MSKHVSVHSSVQRSTILQNIENAFYKDISCIPFHEFISMSLQQAFYKPFIYRCLNPSRLLTGTQSKLPCKQQDSYGPQKQSTQLPEYSSLHVCKNQTLLLLLPSHMRKQIGELHL